MLKITSSQLKLTPLTPDEEISRYAITAASLLKNDTFSFQLVYKSPTEFCQPVTISIETDLPANAYRVDNVAVKYAANHYSERGYVSDLPGLYPDILEYRPLSPDIVEKGGTNYEQDVKYLLNASSGLWQAMLVTINPQSLSLNPGKHTITCTLRSLASLSILDTAVLELEVIDALLPEQTECYTNWFHVDCLCDHYKVQPYSEKFYVIFRSFIKNAAAHRMNTLLIPAFTPALDTPIGHSRQNVQLVGIEKTPDGWSFSFDRLAKFLRTASECGIKYFEHCHLFSQWGAKHTPCIYNNEGNLLFGWDTDASSDEYRDFIRAYLETFIKFFRSKGYLDSQLIFHISDEPIKEHLESYKKAHDMIADIIEGFEQIDALSDVDFYSTGLVKTPVAHIPNAEAFSQRCQSFWLYYTCGTYARNCSNRLITNTAARTRVLGLQMYRYRAKGFLQWGYNFYYDRMSEGQFDPRIDPDGYKLLPGCSYLCYPESDGAAPSLREKHMAEAFDDLRALKLLEKFVGRDNVLKLCEEKLGEININLIPEENALFELRELINSEIKKHAK